MKLTKQQLIGQHRERIQQILDEGGGAEGIALYISNEISRIISKERTRKRVIPKHWKEGNENGQGKL